MTTETQKIKMGYKQTELGVIPEDWDVGIFGACADIYRGGSPRPIQSYLTHDPDGINWIKIGDVNLGARYITSTEEKINQEGSQYSRKVNVGDFLLSNSMSFGRPYVLRINGCIHDGWLAIQNYKEIFNTEYLYYILSSKTVLDQYFQLASGSSVLNLNKAVVSTVKLPIPKVQEQSAIAAALSDADELIEKLERLIKKKKNIKQGAMQELLTGKKRLSGFSKKWETKILGNVANFEHGYGLSKSDLNENGRHKCIHYGQLFTGYKELIREIKSKTNINTNNFYSKGNDVLMPTSDVTPRGLATASCIKEDGIILGGGILIVRLHTGYDGLYLSYFISQNKNAVLKLVKGSTVFHLYANDLAKLEIIFPEHKEQTAIANVLSEMDTEIEKLESQLVKYQNIKQGMMQQLLTGKIRIYGNK
jgi:type I restriction enzyme S subunit